MRNFYSKIESFFDEISNLAEYKLTFERNKEDSFVFDLELINGERYSSIDKHDFSGVLPSGSKWGRFVGWQSFFGMPITAGNDVWYVFGIEKVVPHDTRGGYPELLAYIFQNQNASSVLLNNSLFQDSNIPNIKSERGIVEKKAQSLNEFTKAEEFILDCAFHHMKIGNDVLFRTSILSDNHIDQLYKCSSIFSSLFGGSNENKINYDYYIIGLPSFARRSLSRSSIKKIRRMNTVPTPQDWKA